MFQYSFCSYSTELFLTMEKWRYSFNTASVLIQQFVRVVTVEADSFNTASVLIQRIFCTRPKIQIFVSIQLLFLFNVLLLHTFSLSYIVSIQLLFLFNSFLSKSRLEFMCFNTASVLIQLHGSAFHLSTILVSIQLLFLFNKAV